MTGAPAGFRAVWDRAGAVEGWLTPEQGRRLFDAAGQLGPGATIVEIGSFRGRSTIVLAWAAPADAEVVAIDPHGGGDRGPQEIAPDAARGDADHAAFTNNLVAAGVGNRVRHVRKLSADALDDVPGEVDLLFVDGAHRLGPARADIVRWGDRVGDGGTMLVHDAFSSVGVTLALLSTTAISRGWSYTGRVGSLAGFRRADLLPRDRLIDAARQAAQLPWFARNLAIKCLIVARMGRLTRLLGHRGGWPY
ncbi:MAG: class I SAM-dependent methyltransferase [Acidimicrobiaceae bacterium]|nr:class I SAM-dependent methyltransferase [Acidimicrobiaceae bacterium]